MKKLTLLLIMLAMISLPTFSNQNLKESNIVQLKSSALLGGFTHGGINYLVYGTYPIIDYIVPETGVIYTVDGYLYYTDGLRIDVDITSSNGNFNHNGLLWE